MNYTDLDLSVLKGIVCNKRNALDFINSCETKIFSVDIWQFANIITGYIKVYKEVPTLRVLEEQLSKAGNKTLLEYCRTFWNKLDAVAYDAKEFPFDLQKLKGKYIERQASQLKDNLAISIDAEKQTQEIQRAFQNIKSVKEKKTYESHDIKDYLPTFRERFLSRRNDPTIEIGIKTGFSFLDESTNGVKGADFVLVTAESGFGKSTFLLNAAVGCYLQQNEIAAKPEYSRGHNIAYFSLEMPYENCFNRLISRLSGVAYKKIENPCKVNKEDAMKIKGALDFIHSYPYRFQIIDIPNANSNNIDAVLDNIEAEVVFVDYLGIMGTNDNVSEEQDWLKQGVISYELRGVARARHIPIFSAVQLNRKGGKDSEDAIGLHRLARSAQIATHATCVIQIETRRGEENFSDLNYWIIKNRNGPKGRGQLIKNLACATLLDNPLSKEEEEFGFTNYNEDIEAELEEIDL